MSNPSDRRRQQKQHTQCLVCKRPASTEVCEKCQTLMCSSPHVLTEGYGNSFGSGSHDFGGKSPRENEKQEPSVKPKSKKKKRKNKHQIDSHEVNEENANENQKVGMLGSNLDSLAMGDKKDGDTKQVDDKVNTKESFGKGWWMSNSKTGKADVKSVGGATATGLNVTGNQTRLKFKDFYSDSEDEDEVKEDKVRETKETSESSTIGASLEEALSGVQIGKNADQKLEEKITEKKPEGKNGDKKPEEERKKCSSDHKPKPGNCSYCGKKGYPLACSRCQLTSYCNRQCQKSDYQLHKFVCRRKETFDKFQAKIPDVQMKKWGFSEVSRLLRDLPSEFEYAYGRRGLVMAEIIGPYFHIFRYGICIRDMVGEETHILFYNESNCYTHRTSDKTVKQYPLGECLRPGNFILLLDTCWHGFMDGTVGIRINQLNEVYFIFQS